MEYPGPVVLPAAAVVAFGDYVTVSAQDATSSPGTVFTGVDYRFRNINPIEVVSEFVGPSSTGVASQPQSQFRLLAPTPNPTRGTVSFGLEFSSSSRISAQILGVDGRVVRDLSSSGSFAAGAATLRWDGMSDAHVSLPSAMYFLVVRTGGEARTLRFVLIR
jgi:hypothetical protein